MDSLIDSIKKGESDIKKNYNLTNEFNIKMLKEDHDKKSDQRTKLYDKILLKCQQKIQYKNKCGYYICNYEIPTIGYGIPICNKKECISYLIYKLKNKGFKCNYIGNNKIRISWESIQKEPKYVKKVALGI